MADSESEEVSVGALIESEFEKESDPEDVFESEDLEEVVEVAECFGVSSPEGPVRRTSVLRRL